MPSSSDSPPVAHLKPPQNVSSEEDRPGPTDDTGSPVLSLLDGASASQPPIGSDLERQRLIAADARRSLAERLEAFEDIIDSEVGDTSLSRARNIERETGLRQIFVKFDGGNPTGTQKDRIAFAQALDALRRGYDTISVASCGNYGAAIALAANLAGLRCMIFIPERYRTHRVDEMVKFGAEIRRAPGDYENALAVSRRLAAAEDLYDANPGGANTALQLQAYGTIAYEIYDDLRDAPNVLAVPVSNGTTLAGVYKGFLSLYRRGKTSRMPRFVAGSSYGKNPIINAIRKNSPTCSDLAPERIRETPVNEPLINWHAEDGDLAVQAIRSTEGWAGHVSDRSMLAFARITRDREGLSVLPASTAGLIALLDQHRKEPLAPGRYVAVLTGRKS